MSSLNACFGISFIPIFAVLSSTAILTMAETSLPSLFTDQTFVDDEFCSSTINEHPCVKNILSVLVNHISVQETKIQDNVQEIKLIKEVNKETIELLAKQIKKNQEIQDEFKKNQETNQYRIKLLEHKLKHLEMNQFLETNSISSDISANEKSKLSITSQSQSNSRRNDMHEKENFIGNSTKVSCLYELHLR